MKNPHEHWTEDHVLEEINRALAAEEVAPWNRPPEALQPKQGHIYLP